MNARRIRRNTAVAPTLIHVAAPAESPVSRELTAAVPGETLLAGGFMTNAPLALILTAAVNDVAVA